MDRVRFIRVACVTRVNLSKAVSFNRFGFLPEVVRGTQAMGFVEPTAIQLRAFPIVLAGKDLIGTAQTGTGKTAAFALPILTLLAKHAGLRCLVLEPTRELAAQVETAFRDYGVSQICGWDLFTAASVTGNNAKNSSAASIFSSPHLDACWICWSSVR